MDPNFIGMLLKAIDDRQRQLTEMVMGGVSSEAYTGLVDVYRENERFKETVKEIVDKWNKQWDR